MILVVSGLNLAGSLVAAAQDNASASSALVERVGSTGFIQIEAGSFKQLSPRQQALAYWPMGSQGNPDHSGAGVGLNNVRRRLQLCFGIHVDLVMESGPTGTRVGFAIPLGSPPRPPSDRVVAHSTLV